MKKLLLMGTFALLCTTLFSCTADELETENKDTTTKQVKKVYLSDSPSENGPGDDPIIVPVPPKKP